MPLSPEPIRVRRLFTEVVDLIRPLAQQRRICLTVPDAGAELYVLADNQRLRQVLLNLVSNAVKYNREQGSVLLSAANLPTGRVRLVVEDTGPGLAAAQQARLFNPFDRLGAEATGVEGTGLGLALSKRLAEVMGGTLGLTSAVGRGSTFFIELAAAPGPRPAQARLPEGHANPVSANARARVVLHVEDNPANRALLEGVFVYRPQFRLLSALQGRLGRLELARQYRPDLILLDVHLPDMQGDEVLRQVRADPQLRDTPVIVLSADATPHQRQRLHSAGASDYLAKPIDVARLLALLDRFLQEDKVSP